MLKGLFYRKEEGITLIEVIVSTFILLVAIVGSYLAFTQIFIANSSVSDRLVAAYLAQEGIEVVRNIRDTNWVSGSAWDNLLVTCPSDGCQVDHKTGTIEGSPISSLAQYNDSVPLRIDNNGFYTYEEVDSTPTKFKRKITITSSDADKSDVLVDVMWADRGQSYSFQVEESLYNWK